MQADFKTPRRFRLNPLSLELLVAVVEEGSITAVAERYMMALSAVSKRLSNLEAIMGTSLVRRTNRGIEPSAAGMVLVTHARKVLKDLDEIDFRMREYSDVVSSEARLIANLSSVIGHLPAELSSFATKHPNIVVRLEERLSTVVPRSILDNDADIGLFSVNGCPPGLEIHPYHVDELVLITSIRHRLASRGTVKFCDALDEEFIGLHEHAVMLMRKAATEARKSLKVLAQVASFNAMCAMVSSGLGIGMLPRACVPSESVGVTLSVLALDEPWAHREMVIGIRSGRALGSASQRLYDHLTHTAHLQSAGNALR